MKATIFGALLAIALAVQLIAHVALVAGLARRRPWWRAIAALALPPLAPIWGWREMPKRAHAWAIAFAAYALVIVGSQ